MVNFIEILIYFVIGFVIPYILLNITGYPDNFLSLVLFVTASLIYAAAILTWFKKKINKDIITKASFAFIPLAAWALICFILEKLPIQSPIFLIISNLIGSNIGLIIVGCFVFVPLLYNI